MADTAEATVGIRPENIKPSTTGAASTLTASVFPREDPGGEEVVYLDVQSVEWTMVQTNVDRRAYELEESIGTTSTVTRRWFSTPMSAGESAEEKENSMSEVRIVDLTKKYRPVRGGG